MKFDRYSLFYFIIKIKTSHDYEMKFTIYFIQILIGPNFTLIRQKNKYIDKRKFVKVIQPKISNIFTECFNLA